MCIIVLYYILLSNNDGGIRLLSLVLNVFMIHWRTEDEPVLSQRRSQSAWRERERERDVLSSFRWSVCAALRSCWNVSGMLQCTLGNGCFQLQPWVTNGNHAMTEEASGFVNESPRCSADWFLSLSLSSQHRHSLHLTLYPSRCAPVWNNPRAHMFTSLNAALSLFVMYHVWFDVGFEPVTSNIKMF